MAMISLATLRPTPPMMAPNSPEERSMNVRISAFSRSGFCAMRATRSRSQGPTRGRFRIDSGICGPLASSAAKLRYTTSSSVCSSRISQTSGTMMAAASSSVMMAAARPRRPRSAPTRRSCAGQVTNAMMTAQITGTMNGCSTWNASRIRPANAVATITRRSQTALVRSSMCTSYQSVGCSMAVQTRAAVTTTNNSRQGSSQRLIQV